MAKQSNTGIYQLPNGNWAYRFTQTVNGKRHNHKSVKDENGEPMRSQKAAIRARQLAIMAAEASRNEKPRRRVTVAEVYQEYCDKGRSGKAYTTIRKQDSLWRNHLSARFGARFIDTISVAEILDEGTAYLSGELSLSEDELKDSVVYVLLEIIGSSWEDATDEEKTKLRSSADSCFALFEDDLFSFCVMVVTGAYQANGKVAEAQNALEEAKTQMKELSEEYSDYEHYPNLKGYYTTTNSFFDFCLNPTGSFEQVKTTINDYRNEARDYMNDFPLFSDTQSRQRDTLGTP